MTREEFEAKLNIFLKEVLDKEYGIEHALMVKRDAEEKFAEIERGELPVSILEDYLDPSYLLSNDVYPPLILESWNDVKNFLEYLEGYPEEGEEGYDDIHIHSGIKGLRPDAPEPAKKAYARWLELRKEYEQLGGKV